MALTLHSVVYTVPESPEELPDGPDPALCGVYLSILASSLMALTLRPVVYT